MDGNMDYEVITLKEKTAAGVSVRTSNGDPDMGEKIEGLWNIRQPQLVRLQKIQNRVNMRFSGFRKDGMQDLLFAAIW